MVSVQLTYELQPHAVSVATCNSTLAKLEPSEIQPRTKQKV